MPAPVFVNSGGIQGNISSTSGTANLPGSRVNGNLLVAFIQAPSTGGLAFSVGGGWTIPAALALSIAGASAALAWRYVDGTEAAPVFTWGGASITWHCQVFQYNNVQAVTPIGNTNQASGTTSTTITVAGITSSQANSLIGAYLLTGGSAAPVIPGPTFIDYYYNDHFADSYGGDAILSGQVSPSGATAEAISVSVPSTTWISFGFEILGTGAAAANMRASQTTKQIPESYSTPVMSAHASQISKQIPESYSTPVMFARVSQISAQFIRTQSITAEIVEPANAQDNFMVVLQLNEPLSPQDIYYIERRFDQIPLVRDPWDIDEWGRMYPGAGYHQIR